jgi:hypothetical protein
MARRFGVALNRDEVDRLARGLLGSTITPGEALFEVLRVGYAGLDLGDLSRESAEALALQVERCDRCGTWCEPATMWAAADDELVCDACADDLDDDEFDLV